MYELVQAQTPPPYEPYWSVEYQMGLINVNGEGNFFRMTSPSFSFNAEYRTEIKAWSGSCRRRLV